jgi:hypothetical protein
MREVARLTGSTTSPLAASGFWTRLLAGADRLADEAMGGRLVTVADAIEKSHGADTVELGAWHGDWGHWNMGIGNGALQVWDWERFDDEVPIGFDGLHYLAQSVRPGAREQQRQEDEFHRSLPRTLTELGVRLDRQELTLDLYLLEIAVRYVDALTFGATPALGLRTDWVLSLLERRLDRPQPALMEGRS